MRQYISDTSPDSQGFIKIQGKDYKYLSQVLRLKKNNLIEVRLPSGDIKSMIVFEINKKQIILQQVTGNVEAKNIERGVMASQIQQGISKSPEIWLFQLVSKGQTMDDVIRHCVECGVSRILPILCNNSNKGSADRIERWQRIIKEARQQSGSPINTVVEHPLKIEDALALWNDYTKDKTHFQFVLHEMPQEKEFSIFSIKTKPQVFAYAVGNEGGIPSEILQDFLHNDFNVLHFNTNVLRVDTACTYGLAVLQYAFTEFDLWQFKE